MTILLTPTGTDGSAPTGTGNNARISLVIDAPAGESFAGITAAGTALKSLEKQLDDVNKKMKDLGLKKFPDIGKTVTDQGKKMADAAAGVDKLTSSLEELGKVKTKITKGGELLGGTVETKPFSTGTFKINDKGQAEEIKTKQDLLAQRKSWSKNLDDQNKTEEREQAAADARWKAHADETLREQQEFKNKRESINRKNDFPVTDADAALKRSTADKIARQKLEAKSVAGAGKDFIRIQQESEERKAQARRDAISDSKTQLVEDVNTAKARKATSLTGLKHASGPHADNVARANAEKAYQEEVLKASEQYHARAKTLGDVAGQRAGATAYANAQVKVAEATRQAHIETARLNESYSHIGKNMLQNIAHVTAWSASVGVLYGSLRLLKESVGSMIELQYQQARLSVVMGLSQSETTGLTDEILRLAAANGRSGDDAMKAATQWARLGMTKQQVAEATKVSLMAANVAEITAAEATESLSAIMVTYGLRAAQLNGVLGMLNQTSNNYNVTVGELLSGLERVSSVAKQAGLSLAETQGIIGAAAGATGQTGANIGNSLKSFIGAVAGEEGQKNLRSFGIEATAGGEMKGMTQIVNDLYVAYQRMSEAERRTMIFSTVGKNQAARVTAMLDNYVKSQVLAANSLSNLNSAGNENAVILDTMKSRLQGVITEWQRFVMLQSRNVGFVASAGGKIPGGGPVTETMNAVSNMGKLANTGVGSVGATIIVGLLTAAMMRLGVATAMNAYKSQDWTAKGGILKETAKAMAVSVRDLGLAFRNAGQAAQMSAVDFDAMGRKAKFAASGMGLLKSGAKGLAGLAGGFVAFEIIGAAFNAFSDWVKKATGNTGDFVTEAGDNLADLSNTAGRSAEAYAIAARLFQTSSDALAESVNKPATMSGILSQMDGLNATIPGIEAKFQGLKDNVVGFTAALNAAKIDAKTEQWIAQARSINHLNDAIAQYKARIESLKRGDGAMLQSSRAKEIQEFEKKLAQAQADKVKTVSGVRSGMDADRKAYAESSATSLAFLDAQKIVLGEINTLYKQLAENSDHSFQQSAEAARLRTEADLIKNQVDLITKRNALLYDALSVEERRDPTERIQGLENTTREQVAAHRKQIADLRPTAPGVDVEWGGVPITSAQSEAQIAKLQEEIITLQKSLRAESAKITEFATTNPFIQELTGNRAAIAALPVNESEGKARAAAKAEQERIQADKLRFRQEALAATERARVDSSGIGTNEFEKWSARKAYLDRQREMFNQRQAVGGNTADTRAEQLEREKMAHGHIKDAMVQREVLDGKITNHVAERTKEYRKQLMMMGPGELLTSLALRKMGPNMTGGQLLSMAPSARKLWTDMPGNDAETREMRGALKGFQNLDLTPDKAQKSMEEIAANMRALLNDIVKGRQPALAPFAKELVDMLFKAEIPVVNIRAAAVNVGGVPVPAGAPPVPVAGARASGGPVQKGKQFLVGEEGPELFVPKQSGTILSAGMTGKIARSISTKATAQDDLGLDIGDASKIALQPILEAMYYGLRSYLPKKAASLTNPLAAIIGSGNDIYESIMAGIKYSEYRSAVKDSEQSGDDASNAEKMLALKLIKKHKQHQYTPSSPSPKRYGLQEFGGARASGGPVEKGLTYLVGEKGPELVKMGGNGNVLPSEHPAVKEYIRQYGDYNGNASKPEFQKILINAHNRDAQFQIDKAKAIEAKNSTVYDSSRPRQSTTRIPVPETPPSTPKSELDTIKSTFKSQRPAGTTTVQSAPADVPLPSRSAVPTDTLAGRPKSNVPIDRGYINAKLRNTVNPGGLLQGGTKAAAGGSMTGTIGRGLGKLGMGMLNPASIFTGAALLGKWAGFAGAALEGGRLAYDYKGQTGKVEEASKGGYWASLKQGLGSPMTTIATAGNLFRDINALNHENVSTSDSIAARNKAIENKKHEMAMRPRNWNRNVQRDAADRIPVPESPVGFDALETPSGMFENNPSNYDPSNYDQNLGGAKFYTGGGATDMAEEKSRPKYQTQLKKGEISHPSGALPNRQSIPEVNRFPIVSQDFQHPDWKTPERDPESTDFENGGDVSRQTSANADARRKPQDMTRQSRAYRPTQTIRPYANVPQPGRQTGRPQQAAAAAPRIPVAGNNAPVGGGAPAQGQGGGFPAVMAAASAAVATFSGAISTAAANVTLFSTALTAAMAQMGPRTAFSGAPANADNPFS